MALDILTANDRPGAYPASYYAATVDLLPQMDPVEGELSADVVVIGGGFTGLSSALHLAQAGLNVVLLEASRVGFGASGRNGGQVSVGQRIEQDALEKLVGIERARALWDIGCEAVDLTRALANEHAGGAEWVPGVIHADHKPGFVDHTHAYVRKMQEEYGHTSMRALSREELRALCASDAYHGGLIDMASGHIHPLKHALGLARGALTAGARIYETSRVTSVTEGPRVTVKTDRATIKADHVLWATNGYLGNAEPRTAARVMPINNFIVATEPLGSLADELLPGNHAVADSKFVINYFRLSADKRMLFGGGESYGYKFPADIAAKAGKPMVEIFPQLRDARIDYAWGGTLGITMSRLPHVARLSSKVYDISGYSGQGVALGTMAGKVMAEMVAGQAGRFDLMASVPTPRFPGGAALRTPLLAAAMLWYSIRDRL
ncbi:FAD-binding oxidoreductase [Maritimibacter sp. DP1N21-5]|uniref:NAD(P)/FAD-dependent oxidoreductase n=1 Tax=Maritimibacter sp. DP1N21-5 TaxID=2836867 RepID=UPI001C460570|nr:FAD-binding oxidoreductase [Maritimibacter sp. DP1N21-5]MBV7410576.1 FAD-binding oxidoreductase [Maritimibacter sp. DP1N21-5]